MFNTSKIIVTAALFGAMAATSVSAATIERAGGAKLAGQSTWVAAVTVCSTNQSDCFKLITENDAAGRSFEESDVFGPVVVAPQGSFSVSNPHSVESYVKAQFGFEHVEIIRNNGEEEKDHW